MADYDLDDLDEELKDFAPPDKKGGRSPREERIIAGFEDIQRFFEAHGRAPRHGEDKDIFERLYAVRLDRLRGLGECRALLEPFDHQGLLGGAAAIEAGGEAPIDDDELADELRGIGDSEITTLRHVRSNDERQAAEDIATRTKCEDFETFKPLFEKVQRELDEKVRQTRPFELKAEIRKGAWFIVEGQKAYVAEMGEPFINPQGKTDARLRVIFDNGTESNMLMRSLQRALNGDEAGRRITDPVAGPLFADTVAEDDLPSGTIYVLRSKSDHPMVSANRELVHKIGVTDQDVRKRVAGARLQPTFLMADVEIVATYKLYNVNRSKLERVIHRIFEPALLDIEIKDRFGQPVLAREWFLAPLRAIDDAVKRIQDNTIIGYVFDRASASLKPRSVTNTQQ
jgi:hypothetical protein